MTDQEKDQLIIELQTRLQAAENQLAWFRKQMFGSKSEKHLKLDADSLQPSLFDQECNIDPEEQARLDKLIAEEEKELENLIVIKEHGPQTDRHLKTGSPGRTSLPTIH